MGYVDDLEALRREKDRFFRTSPQSPIPRAARASFEGLSYFPPGERWRVSARVERFPEPELLEIPTSTGEPRAYLRWATLRFEVEGREAALTALLPVEGDRDRLFVPFRDATSAEETYGGGRYLDVEAPGAGEALVDFNLAYNPWCVYADDYSCPLPPPENRLPIRVEAGERMPARE
jgi:uncharacterized protein (DUF1684 family)